MIRAQKKLVKFFKPYFLKRENKSVDIKLWKKIWTTDKIICQWSDEMVIQSLIKIGKNKGLIDASPSVELRFSAIAQ